MGAFTGVSVVIPCYNEIDSIAATLEQLSSVLQSMGLPSEVIVVDDGSTDGTAGQVDAVRYRLVRHERNQGYGAALMKGVRAAQYDCVVITDADGTYPNAMIPELVRQLEDADMAVGARVGDHVRMPLVRRPAKWMITLLANYVTGATIPDLNSGLRAIRRGLWEKYENLFPKGFSLTTTITLAAITNGHRVKYCPIDYHARVGKSKIKPFRDTLNFITLILRLALLFDPLRVFVPISLALFLAGLLLGGGSFLLHLFSNVRFLDTTTVLLFTSSLQMLALGCVTEVIIRTRR